MSDVVLCVVDATYRARPLSRVGQVVVSSMGRQRSWTWDPEAEVDENFENAVRSLVLALLPDVDFEELGARVAITLLSSNDAGTVRRYQVRKLDAAGRAGEAAS